METVLDAPEVVDEPELVADGALTVTVEPRPEPDAVPVALPDCVVTVIAANEPLALPFIDATPPAFANGTDASGRAANSIRPLR
jgi:hypothetical protein